MNWRVGLLCMAIFLAVSAVSHGAEPAQPSQADRKWVEYSKDKLGVTFFYEKDTIVFGNDGTLKVWRKREFPVRSRHRAIVNLDEIDCFQQKHRSHEIQVVGWDDSVETFKRVADWSTIYGDSPEEFFLDNACKEFRKKKK